MTDGTLGAILPTTGDYHGRPTLRLENPSLSVEVLAAAGPRIVGLRPAACEDNLLAETPDEGWETPYGRYELLGGHRLWFAPEDPDRVAVPDLASLLVEPLADGVRLVGAVEPATGLVRSIAVRLDAVSASCTVIHELRNEGPVTLEIAPWSITQLPLGGRVLLPQRRAIAGHRVRPNRNLVLWPYTSWDDPRLRIRDGLVLVDAVPGDDIKLGFLDDAGWVAYERAGTAFVRRFDPAVSEPHPDLGCNVETYCGPRYLELEVLGPLRMLEPGSSAVLEERWEVRSLADSPHEAMELARILDQPLGRPERLTA